MSETAVERGPEPCAFAVVAMRTSPADMTNPVNKFIVRRSSHAPAPRASCSLSRAGISFQKPADLGPDRGAFASNRGRGDLRDRERPMQPPPATFTRLCDTKKFGMVGVRTVILSQFSAANPAQGLQRKVSVKTPKIKGKAVRRGR